MELTTPEANAFLFELYTMTGGDPDAQVSMYDVGESLGLDRPETGTLAESLYIQGLAELKTLSGGIGITRQGLDVLKIAPVLDTSLSLGSDSILASQGKESVEKILKDLKENLSQDKRPYPQLEEMVMDIKTIEVQMLSPNPKTAIIREGLRSLHSSFTTSGPEELTAKLKSLISS